MDFTGRLSDIRALNDNRTAFLVRDNTTRTLYVRKYADKADLDMYCALLDSDCQWLEQIECVSERSDKLVIFSKYYSCPTLRTVLDSGRRFSMWEIRTIILQLIDAQCALAKLDIVHRDINPANILLDEQLHLTLIDFNIARKVGGETPHDNDIRGTEGYTAPEQFGFLPATQANDVFSIGKVLEELLAAELSDRPHPLARRAVKGCTQYEPEKRWNIHGLALYVNLFGAGEELWNGRF